MEDGMLAYKFYECEFTLTIYSFLSIAFNQNEFLAFFSAEYKSVINVAFMHKAK